MPIVVAPDTDPGPMTEQDAAELIASLYRHGAHSYPVTARVINFLGCLVTNGIPKGTEAAVCDLIARRQQAGMRKYGQQVAENPLPLRAWLQHALEEALDQAIYLKRAIDEIDSQSTKET